jgi:hypothetical protein
LEEAGVNLHNIQSVVFDYDETANGTILLSDLAFVDDEEAAPPAFQASQSFIVGASGSVTTPDGSTAVFSSGTGLTRIDSAAQTNGIISVGTVQVGAATVNGNILSAGAVTLASSASVSGTITRMSRRPRDRRRFGRRRLLLSVTASSRRVARRARSRRATR